MYAKLVETSAKRMGSSVRILVVDDDPSTREILAEALELCGAVVRSAASVAEARSRLLDWAPNLVISDVGMPDEDGYDLIRQMRASPPERGGNTPAIAFTGYARPEDRERALRAGYQAVVAKPVDLDNLVATILKVCDREGLSG